MANLSKMTSWLSLSALILTSSSVSATLSNWDISSCSDENTILYAESNERHIVSKNYPSNVPEGEMNCVYFLNGRSADTVITVDFKDFSLSESCQQEKILIEEEGSTLGPFCGSSSPRTYTSKSAKVKIRFIKSGGSGASYFAFGFKGISKDQLRQANSAFAAFDKRRQGSPKGKIRGRGGLGGTFHTSQAQGFRGASGGLGQQNMIANSFDKLRMGKPIGGPLGASAAPILLKSSINKGASSRVLEEPVVASSGIRLGVPGGKSAGLWRESARAPPTKSNNNNNINNPPSLPNSHLKSIGSSNLRGMPSRVNQAGKALPKSKKGNVKQEIRSSVVPGDQVQPQNNVIMKTYSTQQEVDNEINALYNNQGFLHNVQNVQTSDGQMASNQAVSFLSTADSKSQIIMADAFIPSSFIARGQGQFEGNTYLVTESAILSNPKNGINPVNDPIGDFFRNWTVTKSFIAGLIVIGFLIILIAICRWKCTIWMKKKEAQQNAKLQEAVTGVSQKPGRKTAQEGKGKDKRKAHQTIIDITGNSASRGLPGGPKTTPDYPPTYKSVMKNLMVRKILNGDQKVDDDTVTEVAPSSIKTSKTYIPAVAIQIERSDTVNRQATQRLPCPPPVANIKDAYNTRSSPATPSLEPPSVAATSGYSSNCSTLNKSDPSYVDPNGVNPALEREKSRKKFGESGSFKNFEGSSNNCNTNSEITESLHSDNSRVGLDSSMEIPMNLGMIPALGQLNCEALPQMPSRRGNLTITNAQADAALKKIQKDLKMRKKIQKLGSGRF